MAPIIFSSSTQTLEAGVFAASCLFASVSTRLAAATSISKPNWPSLPKASTCASAWQCVCCGKNRTHLTLLNYLPSHPECSGCNQPTTSALWTLLIGETASLCSVCDTDTTAPWNNVHTRRKSTHIKLLRKGDQRNVFSSKRTNCIKVLIQPSFLYIFCEKQELSAVRCSFKVNIWSELLYSPTQPEPSETSFLSFL